MICALNDPAYVRDQYRDHGNLDARIALHERFSTAPRDFHEWVFDHFDLRADARVLELGCGTGALWQKNRARIPAAWQLTLSDFSFGMLQTTRHLHCNARSAVQVSNTALARLTQHDAQTIPFRDDSFDAVVANHMLYHIPNLPRALGEMRRILRVGGKLYAATNGDRHMQEYFRFIAKFVGVETPREPLQFTLENGAKQLQQHFVRVELINFPDGLVVTEVEPLVEYALSGFVGKKWIGSGRESEFRDAIAERIAREGAFRITKATGLFVATK